MNREACATSSKQIQMTNIDVYTRQPIAKPSEEHVVHNFLGGRLKSRTILDKSTNERFGQGIDAHLYRAWQPILVMLDARSHRSGGSAPSRLRDVPGSDGNRYFLEAGGKITVAPRLNMGVIDGGREHRRYLPQRSDSTT